MNNTIQPPENAVESSSGWVWLDESGIIIAIASAQEVHTLEDAIQNHANNLKLADGTPRPFLIDMSKVKSMTREARAFYAGPEPAKAQTAIAIVTNSGIGKLVANFFMSLTKPTLPTRMFTDYREAKQWLMQFLKT